MFSEVVKTLQTEARHVCGVAKKAFTFTSWANQEPDAKKTDVLRKLISCRDFCRVKIIEINENFRINVKMGQIHLN